MMVNQYHLCSKLYLKQSYRKISGSTETGFLKKKSEITLQSEALTFPNVSDLKTLIDVH